MEQTFVVLNLSGTALERSERALAAATAAEKSALNLWAAIGAIVRADGIDALPAFGRSQPTAAAYASTLRRAVKLGRLADCFGQRGDAVLIMGFSAVKAMLQKAAAPAAPAAPAAEAPAEAPAAPAAEAPAEAPAAPAAEAAAEAPTAYAVAVEALRAIARLKGKAAAIAAAALAQIGE